MIFDSKPSGYEPRRFSEDEIRQHQEDVYGKSIPFNGTWISKSDLGMARSLVQSMGKDNLKKLIDTL